MYIYYVYIHFLSNHFCHKTFAYIKKKLYLCSGFWERPEKIGDN